jgi:bacterioferritin-associated ferredoxin
MYLCLCKGVSDRLIRQAIQEGAGSVAAISRTTGACTACGGCREAIEHLLARVVEEMGLAVPIEGVKEGSG